MKKRTLLKKSKAMKKARQESCHDGMGSVDILNVLGEKDFRNKKVLFIHSTTVPAGSTIGVHRHADNEEYYYVLEGRGTMLLDGKRYEIHKGDITGVYPGGSHGLENNSKKKMQILVICAK